MTRLACLLIVCLLIRLIALDADPPPWLSWSAALQTDEGFYTLDARHLSLFGAWAPGNFHDRLLSPLLSVLQQWVFSAGGVGLVSARLVSAAFGMLTVGTSWYGLRQMYGEKTAFWGAFLLGLAPPVAFYSRLALQETPTVFWLVLGYALWAKARGSAAGRRQTAFFAVSGVCVAVAVMFKALAVFALPGFVLAWRGVGPRTMGWGIAGFGTALGLYAVLWSVPHHAELARMSAYYWHHQYAPHSWASVGWNIRRGLMDGERGLLPYLLRFLPLPCLLAAWGLRRGIGREALPLAVWLGGGIGFCLLSTYAPDRYYVLWYPALAGLAAITAARLSRRRQAVALGLFLLTSGFWYARAWTSRTYCHRVASQWLARTLPSGSVLAGEMAPALCLETPFRAAPVQPGLSNDHRPAETLPADYVMVTRTAVSQQWWQTHEPNIVQPSRRAATLDLGGRWHTVVDVYAVKK